MPIIILEKTPAQIFSKRLKNIKYAQLIIEDLKKVEQVKDRNLKEGYILSSYIVYLVACWQMFIKKLLRYGIAEIKNTTPYPLAIDSLEKNCEDSIERFNTPSPYIIDKIFKRVLGIEKITYQLPDHLMVREQIENLLEIRHSIAHEVYASEELSMPENWEKMEMLYSTAENLQKIVVNHITDTNPTPTPSSVSPMP